MAINNYVESVTSELRNKQNFVQKNDKYGGPWTGSSEGTLSISQFSREGTSKNWKLSNRLKKQRNGATSTTSNGHNNKDEAQLVICVCSCMVLECLPEWKNPEAA